MKTRETKARLLRRLKFIQEEADWKLQQERHGLDDARTRYARLSGMYDVILQKNAELRAENRGLLQRVDALEEQRIVDGVYGLTPRSVADVIPEEVWRHGR